MASQQKGIPVSEEDGEDEALEKKDYMEQLVGVAHLAAQFTSWVLWHFQNDP